VGFSGDGGFVVQQTAFVCNPSTAGQGLTDAAVPDAAAPDSAVGYCQETSGGTGTLTGTVYAPNGEDPLPNVNVYIPTTSVAPFAQGVSCDQCTSELSGSPAFKAITAVDGTFTLSGVPAGASVPLVIQIGRWRRQVTTVVLPCQVNQAPASLTRLPRNSEEGDIPFVAVATGSVDALECVFRKIGIADSEFTAPGMGGRINLFVGLTDTTSATAGGAEIPPVSTEDQLWSTQAALNAYDMVLFPCQGGQTTRSAATQQNVISYANAGGRVFATHSSYVWLYNDAPFSGTAEWQVEQHPSPADQVAFIDQSSGNGRLLTEWLELVGASSMSGEIPLQVIRHDFNSAISPSQALITINDSAFPDAPVQYSFDTPVGAPASQQCGRVMFTDFHVENVLNAQGMTFPSECTGGAMTPQEKLLEFMLFDLDTCVGQ
jgi:hypothetical protein